MPKEIIDVIDTAVKIGLGALISGVATYVTLRKNHEHERNKLLDEKKINILEYATENIDPYLHALAECMSLVDGALREDIEPGEKSWEELETWGFVEADNELLSTRKKSVIAESRLKLIGLNNVVKKLDEISQIENKFRQKIIFENIIPTRDEYRKHSNNFATVKGELYTSLQEAFNEIGS